VMAESSYWNNFWRRRVSRRRLLSSAAMGGVGLAAAAMVGCPSSGGGGSNGAASGGGSNVLRYQGYDALVLDSFDPHHTQFGPLYSGHSAVFSKLFKYRSHVEQILVTDLAEDFPEIIGDPNAPTVYVIHLRPGVTFHDPDSVSSDVRSKLSIKNAHTKFPGLPGRELTAEDVKWNYERQKNKNSPRYSTFYRSSQYETMEKIEAIDDHTLRITTAKPIEPLLHFLGDTNAFIIPREVVGERDSVEFPGSEPQSRMIGTGPFMWGELKSLQEIRVYRNPTWFARDDPVDPGTPTGPDTESGLKHPSDFVPNDARRQFVAPPQGATGRPYLDGYVSFMIVDNASIESLFRAKRLDVGGGEGDPQWVFDIKDEHPELELERSVVSGWVNTRFKVADKDTGAACSPWGDPRLRKAIHLAADRQQILDFIWAGEAIMAGPVGPAIKKWALPQDELLKIPGYRTTKAEREEDLAMARQLYEAAGSPELEFVFADVPDYIKDFAPDFLEGLRNSIGANVKKEVIRSYPIIAEQLLKGCDVMKATWGFDNGWIDLDDWVYPYFKTGGPKNSFGVSDPELDKLLDAQRLEFDEDARREIGYQIQRYLLGVKPDGSGPLDLKPNTAAFSRLDYGTLIGAGVSWPYYKNRYEWPWFGNNEWIANQWLDTSDPSYGGRT
jgi:peptide/nickel transport system substrate-binding protein